MSVTTSAKTATRSLRIIAIPLTKPNHAARRSHTPTQTSSVLRTASNNYNPDAKRLTYYHFQLVTGSPQATGTSSSWLPEGGVVKWATGKAAQVWAGFGQAKEGSWKLWVHQKGEKLVDRMDFEELALKGIDPSLGPSITSPSTRELTSEENEGDKNVIGDKRKLTIPLIHPPTILSGTASLNHLKSLVAARAPRHRKGFYAWMLIAPLTTPFVIIPIIPNLPFFFCVWRSWSHYRAYRASQYLQSLLDNGSIVPKASRELDEIYVKYSPQRTSPPSPGQDPSNSDLDASASAKDQKPNSTNSSASSPPSISDTMSPHHLLLTPEAIPAILESFGLKPSAGSDMYRAVEQARVRVKTGRLEL